MKAATKMLATMSTRLVLALAIFGMPCASRGQEAKPKPNDDVKLRQERIENGIQPVELGNRQEPAKLSLAELMKLYKDPGLTVAVIDGYKIAWTKAYGTTELGGTAPVTTKTLFQAGSISKPVAATGMLALVQAGKLALDEDVNVKLKTWKVPENEFTKEQKVTLRRLASHTAGLTVHGFTGYDVDEKVPTIVQILNGEKPVANTPEIRVDFVPGTKWRYSGGGVTIEQLAMTDVSGKPFPTLMKETVLDKIGMTDSSYEQPLPAAWAARTAVGTYASGKSVHGKWHVYPEMAAAGLWTTPTDLAKFVIEIALSKQGKSNKVLAQKTVDEMFTHPPSAPDFGIGIGLAANRPGEFGHDGADEGFQAMLVMNAETGQGVAIMANSDNGIAVAQEYALSVAKEYGWKYGGVARSDAEQMVLIAALKGADAVLQRYDELKNLPDPKKRPEEYVLNMIGYRIFMQSGKAAEAVKVFARNAQEFPGSSNVYDSLAEAYAAVGKKELAIENYEKSLKLDPKNEHAQEELKKLKGEK
ncbi:MAG TPA: serine hydrolase [Candidatus Angelobacter sp.]|nr:serine hydrolase [Candidatus Angelobacter sp.]